MFVAKVRTSLVVEMEVEVDSDNTFEQAAVIGENAITTWIKAALDNGSESIWPHPTYKVGKIWVTNVCGEWKPKKKGEGEGNEQDGGRRSDDQHGETDDKGGAQESEESG